MCGVGITYSPGSLFDISYPLTYSQRYARGEISFCHLAYCFDTPPDWGIETAILFGHSRVPCSDGAMLAIQRAKERIFRLDWKENIFTIANVQQSVREIVHG